MIYVIIYILIGLYLSYTQVDNIFNSDKDEYESIRNKIEFNEDRVIPMFYLIFTIFWLPLIIYTYIETVSKR